VFATTIPCNLPLAMSFSRRSVMKRNRISDYSKTRAPVPTDHEETSRPKEIMLPTMASPVACKKNRKAKSLNFQRKNSARGLRSALRREKSVSRGLGLGLGIHRQSSVSRGLGFSNRTARVLIEASKEEIQFEFPKRPRAKRQRQRNGNSDDRAPPRPNLKVVYDSATQKHNLVSVDVNIAKSRKPPITCQSSPSLDVKDASFRTVSSPISVIDDLSIPSSPTNAQVRMSPEGRSKFCVPIKSTHTRIVISSGFHLECENLSAMPATPKVISSVETETVQSSSPSFVEFNSKPKFLWEAPALRPRGKRIQELIAKLGID
jgi:hypothetical protein